jgi:nitrous oxide reductase accessory protein NosL
MRAVFCFLAWVLMVQIALAETPQDIQEHPTCKYCDMNRQHYAHSRMLIEYENSSFGSCSLHCVAIDLALNIDKIPVSIKVADFNTTELIDAESAFWVIGGNKPGVMTKRAKWAFAKKRDADDFIARNGGVSASFDEAIKAAYRDMYEDSRMIRGKRKIFNMHR